MNALIIPDTENVARALFSPKKGVEYDVKDCSQSGVPSHAGIFITMYGENLIGGKVINTIEPGFEQDFMMLAIQRELVDIAQKGLYTV